MASARPTLHQLRDALAEGVASEWYDLGVCLEVSSGILQTIEQDYGTSHRRLTAMIETWLSKNPKGCWRNIIDALKEMDKNNVVGKITEKYLSAESSSVPAVEGTH